MYFDEFVKAWAMFIVASAVVLCIILWLIAQR